MVEGEDITLSYLECPELASLNSESEGFSLSLKPPIKAEQLRSWLSNGTKIAAGCGIWIGTLAVSNQTANLVNEAFQIQSPYLKFAQELSGGIILPVVTTGIGLALMGFGYHQQPRLFTGLDSY